MDGLDLYEKDYKNTNKSLISKAQDIWDSMHMERTNMLWQKEEYINLMHNYTSDIKKKESIELIRRGEEDRLESISDRVNGKMRERRGSGEMQDPQIIKIANEIKQHDKMI